MGILHRKSGNVGAVLCVLHSMRVEASSHLIPTVKSRQENGRNISVSEAEEIGQSWQLASMHKLPQNEQIEKALGYP